MDAPIAVRRLGPGDEDLLARLALDGQRYEEDGVVATGAPLAPADASALLSDDRTHLFVAFATDGRADDDPVGFVVVNELLHWHTFGRMLLIYEIGVADDHRRRGVGRALFDAVRALAVERRIPEGFVLTNESNAPAMGFYAAVGGTRPHLDVAEWDFDYRF
jgi:ribosomal protein S18 acetylase RimI-like enzyme